MNGLNRLLEVFILDIFNSRDLTIDSNLDIKTANVTVEYSGTLAAIFMHDELSKYLKTDKLYKVNIGTSFYNMVKVNLYEDSYNFVIQEVGSNFALIVTKDNIFFSRNYNRLISLIESDEKSNTPEGLMSEMRKVLHKTRILNKPIPSTGNVIITDSIVNIYNDTNVEVLKPTKVYSVKSLNVDEHSNRDSPILVFTEDEVMFIRNELIDVLKYNIKLLKEYYLVDGKGPFEYLPKYDQYGLTDVVDYYNSYKTIRKNFDGGCYLLRTNGLYTKNYHYFQRMICTHRDLLIDKFKLYALSPYNDPESPKLYDNWLDKILKKQYLIKSNECY